MEIAQALPLTVVLLKILMKLLIDRNATVEAIMKVVIAFPIDLIFLAFAYGVAKLAALEANSTFTPPNPVQFYTTVSVLFFLASIFVVWFCSVAEVRQASGKLPGFFFFFLAGLAISTFVFVFVLTL